MMTAGKRRITVVCILALGGATFANACSDHSRDFEEDHHSSAGAGGEESHGEAASAGVPAGGGPNTPDGAAGEETGGVPATDPSGGASGVGGMASDVPAPPSGAFAWYKATADDVVIVNATLADGNDFIKTAWGKTNVTAEALQPDMDGGNGATAIYGKTPISGTQNRSFSHAVGSSSIGARQRVRIKARMGAYRFLQISDANATSYAQFDLLDGAVGVAQVADATIRPLKNLWYECEAMVVVSAQVRFVLSNGTSGPAPQTEPLAWVQGAEVEQVGVTIWKDRIGGKDLKNEVAAWRWVPSSAELGGLPALEHYFRTAPGFELVAGGNAEDWAFLHNGTGGTLVLYQRQLGPSAAYPNSVQTVYKGAHEGFHLGLSPNEENKWRYSVTNQSAETLFAIEAGDSVGPQWLAATYATEQSPPAKLFQDGALVGSANVEAEPASTSGNLPLTLGGAFGPTQLVHEVLAYDRVLDNDEIAQLKDYFAAPLRK